MGEPEITAETKLLRHDSYDVAANVSLQLIPDRRMTHVGCESGWQVPEHPRESMSITGLF